MYVKSLTVKNFRNYANQSVAFEDGLNVLYGENASGKTNIIEAVYLLGVGKSPRTSNEKELIKIGEERAYIKAVIQKKYRSHTIEVAIDKSGKKIIIDGIPAERAAELIGVLNIVFFSPDEMRFIKESPVERRKFIDIAICQQNKNYFRTLVKYNHILKQRNKLLKDERDNRNINTLLELWDKQLIDEGARIIETRVQFLKELQQFTETAHDSLTAGKEKIVLSYDGDTEAAEAAQIRADLTAKFAASLEKDKFLQYTTVGPHRDDLKITLNGNDARKIASQGQQRTAALSILIGELQLFKKLTGESPVLLLDDVLSELDKDRRAALLSATETTQTLLTTTEKPRLKSTKSHKVVAGTIKTE